MVKFQPIINELLSKNNQKNVNWTFMGGLYTLFMVNEEDNHYILCQKRKLLHMV